jgi:hypothetical protein
MIGPEAIGWTYDDFGAAAAFLAAAAVMALAWVATWGLERRGTTRPGAPVEAPTASNARP